MTEWLYRFFSLNLLQLLLRDETPFCFIKNVSFSLCIDKTCVRDVLFWEPA